MNFKKHLFLWIFFLIIQSFFGQVVPEASFWDNVRFGGNLGLDFSNGRTSLNVAPSAIYQVNSKFSAGASVGFGYSSFKTNDAKQYNYGASLISLYNPITGLQLSGELEHTFVNQSIKSNGVKITDNFNFPALYLGAGYRLGNVTAGFRYDVLYKKERSIYGSALAPFVRVYF